MSDQTVAESVKTLREQMVALDEAITEARVESARLDKSASTRASFIRLERAAIAKAAAAVVDTAPAEPSITVVSEAPAADKVTDEAPAFGSLAVEPAQPEPTPEPKSQSGPAGHLRVVPEPAKPSASPVTPLRDPKSAEETSPLALVDDDVEAAFDKFFSTDVEPEPAQRWLLSES